mmetsp:Transcript_4665/g.6388  ORF Transcript_4665/g.6388 Transcript_4665/m.6388 type:complete len:222 (+) Transcript_4665:799-1464(+)
MSMRIIASSVSNMNSLSALQSSVFPTPVGPRKISDAIGFDGSFNPARDLCMASVTTSIASSCPITLSFSLLPIDKIRSLSDSSIFCGGMPVHTATTFAISSATTSSRSIRATSSASSTLPPLLTLSSFSSSSGKTEYFSSAALLRSNSRSHFSISSFTSATFSWISFTPSTAPLSACQRAFNSSCFCLRFASSSSMLLRRCDPVSPSPATSDCKDKRSISS